MLPDAVLLTDHEGRIRLVNTRLEELFGFKRSTLLDQPAEILIPERFRQAYLQHWKEFVAAPRTVCLGVGQEVFARCADGTEFPVQLYLTPLPTSAELFILCSIRHGAGCRQGDATLQHNEEILRLIPNHIHEVFFVSDIRTGQLLYISPAYESIWGRSCQSLYREPMSWLDAIHPDDRQRVDPLVDAFLERGDLNVEYRIVRPDGTQRWISDRAFPVKDPCGNVLRSVGIAEDITESKLAEETLRLSEERFRLLVDNTHDYAIFMLDPQGRVSNWNSGAQRMTGYSADEIIGKDFSCFFTKEDLALGRPRNTLRFASDQGRFEDDGWRLRKDGSRFWANAITSAIRDSHGEILGFGRITRDITEHKKAEEALLFELSNALLTHRNVQELFSAISTSIQNVVPHDYAALALFDPDTGRFRVQLLDTWNPQYSGLPENILPVQDTVPGRVFTSGVPLLVSRVDRETVDSETFLHLSTAGIASACWLPLTSRDRALGALMVGSRREAAFTSRDMALLEQISGQIALAVDNALAFHQISENTHKLSQHKRYLEDELNLESSFDDVIGESSSLKRVLKQVETVAPTDATVLILGET
ncbi:MAG: PAS domain S-box protein, partial [Acidobacteriia bacterium]|nr:PAS domain S-box protein [Terriglobia bacterium]